jgi:hypothetical protein
MGISDETLLNKLAGDNVELRRQLERLLGSESFAKAPDEKPGPTKH